MDQSKSLEAQLREKPNGEPPKDLKILRSESLFADKKEIGIAHGDFVYRLKITRQGKLILNK